MTTSFWKTRSIRSQLLFMGLLVIIPAISLVAWFISQDYQSARNSAYSKVGSLAQETANRLGDVISENKSVLERIAGRPLVQAMDRTRCDPILKEYIEVRPEYGTLAIRDTSANIICSRLSNPPPASAIITRPWFQEISRTRRFTISEVRMRESPPGWVFISASPILNAQSQLAGVIFFSTDLTKLNHHLFQPGNANTIVEVVDQNGHFVLRSIDPENWIGKSAPSPLTEQFASRPAGSFVYAGDDRIRRIYASAPVPGTGWYALAGLPEDEVLAEPRRHLYQGIATGAIVLLLVIALAITVSINITNPLHKLAGFSDKLAAGDAAARVADIGGSAEVTHLGQALNVMAEKLHDRQTDLDEAQRLAELGNWQWIFDAHEIKGSAETLRIHGCDEKSQPLHLDRLVQHYAPESRDELRRAIEQAGQSGIPYAIDLKTVDDRWITARGEAIRDEHGSIRGIRGTWQDITERKHAMEQINALNADLERRVIQRTSQLEKTNELLNHALESADAANLAKSAFLANMSHEIRTPLNAISGMSHLIKRDGVTPQQSRRIDAINSAGRHLLRIVDDILDISKIEAGKLVLEETEIQIAAIAADAASMVSESAREKNLQLVVDMQPLPRLLLGDPTRIRQALLNYLSNSIKFTTSGKVVLRGCCEQETADDAIIRFEVEDTGIGISEETSQRLFARFEQADNSTTRKYGGTGLGLAIVRKLALLMGGDAGFNSALGVGSTFWFTIHLKKASGAVPADTRGATQSAESILNRHWVGRRVLLVEDEPVNREISQILLEDAGLSVDLAEDGLEAVQRAGLNDYDIILMDMQMPRMDGLEATSMIRKLPNGGNVPIIAMTANTFVQDKMRCIDAGMNDFVSKPVKPALLYEMLLKWLQKEQCATHS